MRFKKKKNTEYPTWVSACGTWTIEERPCWCPFVAFRNGSRVVQTPTLAGTKLAVKRHEEGFALLNRRML